MTKNRKNQNNMKWIKPEKITFGNDMGDNFNAAGYTIPAGCQDGSTQPSGNMCSSGNGADYTACWTGGGDGSPCNPGIRPIKML